MQTCTHENVLKLMTGWHCPDCGESFDAKPKPKPKAEPEMAEEKPKTKTKKSNSTSASK